MIKVREEVLSIKVITKKKKNPNCLLAFMVLVSQTFLSVNQRITHVSEVVNHELN